MLNTKSLSLFFFLKDKIGVLLIASVVLTILMIDSAFIQVGAPYVVLGLQLTSIEFAWVLNISFIATALFLIIAAPLARRLGVRNLFILGLLFYTFSLYLCGFSHTFYDFFWGRFCQGVSVAILAPTGLTALVRGFPSTTRGRAVGFTAAISSVFFTISPIFAGYICELFSWRVLYAAPLFFVVIGFILAFTVIPKEKSRVMLVDFRAYSLYFITFVLGIVTLMQGLHYGWTSIKAIISILCTLLFLSLFIYLHIRKKIAIIDFTLFKYRSFWMANSLVFLVQCIFVHIFFWSIFFYRYLHLNPMQIAGLTMVATSPLLLFSYISGLIIDRKSAYLSVIIGLLIFLVSTLFFYMYALNTQLFYLFIGLGLFGIALSLVGTPLSVLVVKDVPEEKHAEACSIYQIFRFYGSVLGVLFLSVVNTSLENTNINSWWSRFFPARIVENITLFTFSIDNFLVVIIVIIALFLTLLSWKPYKENNSLVR